MKTPEIEYADGFFKAVKYHRGIVLTKGDELEELAQRMTGVKSPAIKDPESAKYQRGTQIYKNNIGAMLEEKQRALDVYNESKDALTKIGRFLNTQCSQKETELMYMLYEQGYNYREIGFKMHYSYETIRQKRNAILKRFVQFDLST